MRRWSFHTVALASGGADEELAAKKELLARLRADTALSSWQRSCSFRVVGRAQLEELVRATHAEETEARRREERKALQEAAGAGEGDTAGDAEEDKEDDDAKAVVVSPALLALAFQRLVARDKREFLAYPQSDPSEAEGASAQAQYSATEKEAQGSEEGEQDPAQPPARVYLLVDYPTSLAEVTALLRLGEVGSASQVDDGPENLPLLPLIDGVVLLADPSAARGRNRSSSTNVPRNRGGSVVKAEGGTSRMSVMETTAFQTSNAVVKVFYEAAQVGGIEWSDFTFTNIGCGATTAGTKSTEELEKEIISTVEEIAAQKFAFKNWMAYFLAVLRRNQDASSNLEEFVEYGDIVGCRIASAQLFREALQADGDPCFVARGHRIDDIERAMWRRSDFPGVGNEGRKIMPRTPQLSEPERSVRNTELATFYESPRFSSWMTNALVERRPNGVIIVTLTSGARVTYHADGTGMYLNAGNTHVLVKKRGFADVCIDVDVNITAQHHSAGERVAVTKGGLRVRSVVDVYDGTRVEISYNTKVTAQVNGRVTTRKPSGQIVVAKDSGRVEYISPGSMKNPAGPDSKDDDDRDVTSHNGVYYFDCRQGHFQLCDNEQNQFRVEFNGTDKEEGPSVAVDLAGVVSDAEVARYEVDAIPAKAVINEPIPPHVFVLNGDGSGVEIPRPQDIAGYIEGVATENQVGKTGGAQLSTTRSHVFLRHLRDSRPPTPIFNDAKVHAEMLGLQQPVATAAKYLPRFFAEAKITTPSQQFTTVRRIQQIEPLSADELLEMHAGWTKWEQWQEEREANKECYKVVDPRQPEVIAQEVAMQKKVLAAYKATRARKKLARQKAREMKAKNGQELSPGLRMETVQEGEETLGDEGEGESDDEFGQFGSDMSDDDVGETAEVDDPMELLWSAFSQADTEGRGLLSIAQTRLGVVNVLGIGVTANELTEALVRFKIPYPFNVSFDVFADLVAFFRSGDESNQDSEEPSSDQGSHIPSLKGMAPAQREGHGTPRGSAAEAIRARHLDGGSMSC
ncbi:hypothetical protein PHYSODRAFT_328648 [Phytophthora sojae]|uniref:EF-hand domain-containing protein n=1 Tax=Phytophthora sojae (strain P6497) TaxID=1094619 RepID=G4Z9Z8_PHYSP|nr:hypothetical protein PHYSODRAFT_328648 [Phytophthora sojae]EGZ20547.1 hypothetical protein PHYSODRAFT_328648 [Phytophthora sojae]|eukprot:XP_009523264.1 hypothetical protein PHYSODRAFT_328648 [Phytophthora sojae]